MLACQSNTGAEREEFMKIMSIMIRTSTRQAAKGAGAMDLLSLCRKHMTVFFGPVVQAASANLNQFDRFPVWNGRTAPANAAGSLRSALTAGTQVSGFSKPTRYLTEQRIIK
jgi:hypothetical protein